MLLFNNKCCHRHFMAFATKGNINESSSHKKYFSLMGRLCYAMNILIPNHKSVHQNGNFLNIVHKTKDL